jgi:hypothetical protein
LLGRIYDDPFYPRFWKEKLKGIERPGYPFSDWSNNNQSRTIPIEYLPVNRHAKRKARGIFACDMGDLFGIGVPEEWTQEVLDAIRRNGVDRFYLLAKQPQNLIKFSPFPENCWVGVTATGYWRYVDACNYLTQVEAKVKFLSLEPLLTWDKESAYFFHGAGVKWLIIGACTGSASDIGKVQRRYPDLEHKPLGNKWTAQPKIEWVKEIVDAAGKAGVKVFLKNNLDPLLRTVDGQIPSGLCDNYGHTLRQEMPCLNPRQP